MGVPKSFGTPLLKPFKSFSVIEEEKKYKNGKK
jgi:hypothetical protein